MAPLIRLREVTCSYERRPALINVDLDVEAGDFVGIVGPSGSGKTTLLKLISGAMAPTAGEISVPPDLRLGYVPQVENVDWHFPITVLELLLMGRIGRRRVPWPSSDDLDQARRVLERLDLEGLERRHIRELSGGQQQRAFIGRALLGRPDVLLLDEPTSGIDVRTRHEVMHLLGELHRSGIAVLLSTHDLNGIAAHLPRIVCLNRKVIAAGRPKAVITPAVLEQTYGAPLEVLMHAGMPVVIDSYSEEHGSKEIVELHRERRSRRG